MNLPIAYLLFADPTGTDLPFFNTLRLRGTWARRLKAGDTVAIGVKHEIVAFSTVTFVDVGRVRDVLQRYAASNHLELALAVKEGRAYERGLAPERRWESMMRRYGPQKLNEQSLISVIGLKREK